MRPWERKLALTALAGAFALALWMQSCEARARGFPYAERRLVYLAVLCPPNWRATISQRYDDRDRWDWIVKRTWITRCI